MFNFDIDSLGRKKEKEIVVEESDVDLSDLDFIEEPEESKPEPKPKKKSRSKNKTTNAETFKIEKEDLPAILFALNKCLNLFKSKRFDDPSGSVFYFKKVWKKLKGALESEE